MRRNRSASKLKSGDTDLGKYIWATAILALIILIIAIFNNPFSVSDNASSGSTTTDTGLDILYLHGRSDGGTLLQAYAPGDSAKNYTVVNTTHARKFGHNILDRKYNSELRPEVNIYIDSYDTPGMILNFKLEFYLFDGNTLATEPVATAVFSNYTTKGSLLTEFVEIKSTEYEGKPVDIGSGGGFGASVRLTVWRTDDLKNNDVKLHCGADGKVSWIRIPYDRSLSSTKKNDDNSTPMDSGLLLIVAISTYCIFFYYRRNKYR
jgi:hypothetical protein